MRDAVKYPIHTRCEITRVHWLHSGSATVCQRESFQHSNPRDRRTDRHTDRHKSPQHESCTAVRCICVAR